MCFQNLKDWYNFDLGECLKHRTQFSCSIYCKDKGDLEETIYFSYIIDIKIQQGFVFLQVARTGEKPWGTIHQKQMPESFNIYKNHIPWKALCSVCFMRPFMYKYMLGKHTHVYIYTIHSIMTKKRNIKEFDKRSEPWEKPWERPCERNLERNLERNRERNCERNSVNYIALRNHGRWNLESSSRNKFAVPAQDTVKQQTTVIYRSSLHFLNIFMYIYIFTYSITCVCLFCQIRFFKACRISYPVVTCRHEGSQEGVAKFTWE